MAKSYHNPEYEKLMKIIGPSRKEFQMSKTYEGRMGCATAEYDAWQSYVKARTDEIKSDHPTFALDPKQKSMLGDQFDRLKHRDTMGIPGPELVEFHGEFAKKFNFKVPIHPRHLSQMIHPFQGYLANMQKHFRYEDLV